MSHRQVLPFEIVGSAGNIDAVFNRFTMGLHRVTGKLNEGQRTMGAYDRQVRAMGTTIRYFFAGQVVFGALGAIKALRDFQVELGNVDTVATRLGGVQGLGSQLDSFGTKLIDISDRTITPVNQLTEAVTQLYSSLEQDVDTRTVERVTNTLAKVARVSQVTNPQALVGSLLGGVTAFGLPQGSGQLDKSVGILGDQFKRVLQRSRNISGEEYATYSGNLYKSAALAGLTAPQAGGLVVQASQFGGSASSIVQNLSQLLTYLRHPKTKTALAAYAQAGISQTDLLSDKPGSGFKILSKLITHARELGITTSDAGKSMTSDDIANLSDDTSLGATGISGRGAQYLANAFPRIQSQRTLTVLANESVPTLQRKIDDIAGSGGEVDRAFKSFVQDAPLARLGNDISNFRLTLIRNLQPGLNPVAKFSARGLEAVNAHPNVALALEAALGVGMLGRRISKGKFGKNAAGAAIAAEEAPNLLTGSVAPDGSRANPIWVMISPASWYVGSPGGMATPTGDPTVKGSRIGKFLSKAWGKTGGPAAGAAAGLTAKYGGKAALKAGGVAGFLAALPEMATELQGLIEDDGRSIPKGNYPALRRFSSHPVTAFGIHNNTLPTASQKRVLDAFSSGKVGARRAENLLEAMDSLSSRARGGSDKMQIEGEASGHFTFKFVDAQGRTIVVQEQKGVPVRLWGATKAPSSGGKPKSRTGGMR